MAAGGQLPGAIQNAPQLEVGLELYFEAFWDLGTHRSGMGDGPIMWLAIEQYADRLELDEVQRSDLHYYIQAMDEAFHQHREKTRPKPPSPKQPQGADTPTLGRRRKG